MDETQTLTPDDARPGLICTDYAGHVMRLDRSVPGDAWEWDCDLWIINHWSAGNRVHLSELTATPDALKVAQPEVETK